jgi:hypothetical protein
MNDIDNKFIFQCKKNYLDKIRPSDKDSFNVLGYQILINIAKIYFEKGEIEKFSSFFQEFQYNINLWTAHLILEYGQPNEIIKGEAIEIIERYSSSPLDIILAYEEKQWLIKYNLNTDSSNIIPHG